LSLTTLDAARTRVYCEAAGLIGDGAFLAPLARIAPVREEAVRALAEIAAREKITARSKILRDLDEPLRLIVARALIGL
jgi:HEAT repeat protein